MLAVAVHRIAPFVGIDSGIEVLKFLSAHHADGPRQIADRFEAERPTNVFVHPRFLPKKLDFCKDFAL